jgi:hypothetical protein
MLALGGICGKISPFIREEGDGHFAALLLSKLAVKFLQVVVSVLRSIREGLKHRLSGRPLISLAIVLWICFGGCLAAAVLRTHRAIATSPPPIGPTRSIQGFAYVWYDSSAMHRPVLAFDFNSLDTVNSRAGIFKTGLCSTLRITGLHISTWHYGDFSQQEDGNSWQVGLGAVKNAAQGDYKQLFKFCGIDTSRIIRLACRDFQFESFNDSDDGLKIQSASAEIADASGGIHFRGLCTITAAGRQLTCSKAIWNPRHGRFEVSGKYILKQTGRPVLGTGACFDEKLNVISNSVLNGEVQ